VSCDDAEDASAWRTMSDRHVLLRSDNGNPLGIVSDGYKPVQPKQVLEFFRDLTEAAGFQLETAGTLFGGKRMWALASIGAEAKIASDADKVRGFLLLCTACDGSMVTEGRYTTVRVVCNNTLGAARDEGAASVRVSHRTKFDADSVKRDMGIEAAQSRFDDTIAHMRKLADTAINPEVALYATADLFVPDFRNMSKPDQMKQLSRNAGIVHDIGRLAIDGKAIGSDLEGAHGTAWGWLNAVTEYVDHHAHTRGEFKADNRINSAWFGRGHDVKQQAFTMANNMADHFAGARSMVAMPTQGEVATMDGSDILSGLLGKPAKTFA
jgi:phage/plasmid-like protein (TIGR03299 family)